MEEEFNNLEIEYYKEKNSNNAKIRPSKQISKIKRKELLNNDSDNDDNINSNNNNFLQKIRKEESKEENNIEYKNENKKIKCMGNQFKTIDENNEGGTSVKDKTTLQEKLKKIFMNRDKLKFQYTKQDIPENLKYLSDDSESSEVSGLKKGKMEKKINVNCQNKNKYSNIENNYTKNKQNSKSDCEEVSTFSSHPSEVKDKEKIKNKNEENENFDFNKLNNSNEDENIKSNEKEEINIKEKEFIKYNQNWNNNEEKKEREEEKVNEENDINQKENAKKNLLLKMFEKRGKNEIIQNNETEEKPEISKSKKEIKHEEDSNPRKERLLKLKMLLEKKDSNKIEQNEEQTQEEPKNDLDIEKEKRRKKIIEQLQLESNSPSIKKIKSSEILSEPTEENQKTEVMNQNNQNEEKDEENDEENEEENESNDKGTYISNMHKNKLTISIKRKAKLVKNISSAKKEKKSNNGEKNDIEKQNKKATALLDILEKLKKKKTEEQNIPKKESKKIDNNNPEDDDDIGEKKTLKNKQIKNEEKFNKNYKVNKNERINNENEKIEEFKKRKQLEEDLREEMNVLNEEDEFNRNNSKPNFKNNLSNKNISRLQNEDKNKTQSYKKKISSPSINIDGGNKNMKNESSEPNEIIINNNTKGNFDRSFDAASAYMKRKIPSGRNKLNIYNKPKKANINECSERNKNIITNNSNSLSPKQNYNDSNNKNQNTPYNFPNKLTYFKKKSSFNDKNNFILNNQSFCDYPKEYKNSIPNQNRNRLNMEIDINGGLNSSFDGYMKMNINNNIKQGSKEQFYGTTFKNYNNGNYNRATHIPVTNLNYNRNYYYKKGNAKNTDVNRSFGYIDTNSINNNFGINNIFYNNDLAMNTNLLNKNQYILSPRQKYVTHNNDNKNSNYFNNNSLLTYTNNLDSNITSQSYYPKSPVVKRYESSKTKGILNKENDKINGDLFYQNYENNNTSINIEDLLVLEEKLNEIIISLNKNHEMHNECFEFWNYYYNCSFNGKLPKLFKNENDSIHVQNSINHILLSIMICYDFSFEIEILKNDTSILGDLLKFNHKNLIIIYQHILSKVSSESKTNPWVYKLQQLINNYMIMDDKEYISNNRRKLSLVEKIIYNVNVIVQNIRQILKNYKTSKNEYLTNIFKKINEKTYEEINSYFRDNILRVDNVNGSVLASVFLRDNECFQTEPAPYIKTINRKKYSLILDLDETLVHFKINSQDDSEGVLQIRPGVIPFLEEMGKFYELIVFTAATQDYGDLLIDAIEENNLYFEHRFYRQHTVIIGNDFVKDLNRIGRPIDKIIIVDNMPQNFRLQKENGINIKAFWGEDANDNALEELGKILINIAKDGGDVRIGLQKYRDEIVKKVTSNISKSNF